MLLISQVVPAQLGERLRRLNIRYAEQFVAMMRTPAIAQSLARSLDRSVQDLDEIVLKIVREYPDLDVPRPAPEEHGTGYGKREDFEKFKQPI